MNSSFEGSSRTGVSSAICLPLHRQDPLSSQDRLDIAIGGAGGGVVARRTRLVASPLLRAGAAEEGAGEVGVQLQGAVEIGDGGGGIAQQEMGIAAAVEGKGVVRPDRQRLVAIRQRLLAAMEPDQGPAGGVEII